MKSFVAACALAATALSAGSWVYDYKEGGKNWGTTATNSHVDASPNVCGTGKE